MKMNKQFKYKTYLIYIFIQLLFVVSTAFSSQNLKCENLFFLEKNKISKNIDNSHQSIKPSVLREKLIKQAEDLVDGVDSNIHPSAPNQVKREYYMRVQLYDIETKKFKTQNILTFLTKGFLNIFQNNGISGGGLSSMPARVYTEANLLGLSKEEYIKLPDEIKAKYLYLNLLQIPLNIDELEGLAQYGGIIFVFNDSITPRTTIHIGDSLFSREKSQKGLDLQYSKIEKEKLSTFIEGEVFGPLGIPEVKEILIDKDLFDTHPEIASELIKLCKLSNLKLYSFTNGMVFNQTSPLIKKLEFDPNPRKLSAEEIAALHSKTEYPNTLPQTNHNVSFFLDQYSKADGTTENINNEDAKSLPQGVIYKVKEFASALRKQKLSDSQKNKFIRKALKESNIQLMLSFYGRNFFIQALGLAANEQSVEILTKLLKSKDYATKWGAITALMSIARISTEQNIKTTAFMTLKKLFLSSALSSYEKVAYFELLISHRLVDEDIYENAKKVNDPSMKALVLNISI